VRGGVLLEDEDAMKRYFYRYDRRFEPITALEFDVHAGRTWLKLCVTEAFRGSINRYPEEPTR
jgi:hypothetical protein